MNDRLRLLLTEIQGHDLETEAGKAVLEQLVDEILRSRKICRSFNRQPLSPICQTIYNQVRSQLIERLRQELTSNQASSQFDKTKLHELSQSLFKQVLNDGVLTQLAIEAQQHLPKTLERRHALGELIEAISISGKLQCYGMSPIDGRILISMTLEHVCEEIDQYKPERASFMAWVNFYKGKPILRRFRKENTALGTGDDPFDKDLQVDNILYLSEQVRECIEEDPDKIFKTTWVEGNSEATFQRITLARLDDVSWGELSEQFGCSVSTLSSFHRRRLKEFAPQIKKYIQNH
jgi:DNA-directed RNA polymerase specialized sigma24 family protein